MGTSRHVSLSNQTADEGRVRARLHRLHMCARALQCVATVPRMASAAHPHQQPPRPKNGTLEMQSIALFSRKPRDRSSLSRSGLIIFNEFPAAKDFTPCGNSEETKKVMQLHLFLSQPPARLFICCLQQPVPRLQKLPRDLQWQVPRAGWEGWREGARG